jgi:hypothetical protein
VLACRLFDDRELTARVRRIAGRFDERIVRAGVSSFDGGELTVRATKLIYESWFGVSSLGLRVGAWCWRVDCSRGRVVSSRSREGSGSAARADGPACRLSGLRVDCSRPSADVSCSACGPLPPTNHHRTDSSPLLTCPPAPHPPAAHPSRSHQRVVSSRMRVTRTQHKFGAVTQNPPRPNLRARS